LDGQAIAVCATCNYRRIYDRTHNWWYEIPPPGVAERIRGLEYLYPE